MANSHHPICRLTLLVSMALLAMEVSGGELIWGVCGHPAGSYHAVPIETQIALLKELGATWYRIDVGTNLDWLDRIAAATAKEGIRLLPIIQPPVRLGDTKWTLHRGGEYPGAKGKVEPVWGPLCSGEQALRLEYDLQAPTCRYVAAIRRLDAPLTLDGLEFAVLTDCAIRFLIRMARGRRTTTTNAMHACES